MDEFIKASQTLGKNIAYIQGAGGNASIKVQGKLYIKASGYLMSQMRENYGISCCNYQQIRTFLQQKKEFRNADADEYTDEVKESVIKTLSFGLPSMETGMHAVIPSKYVFHLHSVYVNIFTCMHYGSRKLRNIFPQEDYEYIHFVNPGYQLASVLTKKAQLPHILFLQNHGLVIHGNTLSFCLERIAYIHEQIITYLKKKQVFQEFGVRNESTLTKKHLFPDSIVFSSVEAKNLSGQKKEAYLEIMSASQYITEMIEKLAGRPKFIDSTNVHRILHMGQEQHRLKVFHT